MADNKLDTGSGGFPIDDKAQTYDVGVTSSEPSAMPYTPGNVSVDKTNKDVSDGTKKTLASYLSKTTLGTTPSAGSPRSNEYPVVHNEGSAPSVAILNDPRNNRPVGPQIPVNEKRHVDAYIPADERSPRFETAKDNTKTTGHKLLKDYMPLGPRAAGSRTGFSPPFPERPTTSPDPVSPINEYYGTTTQQLSNSVIYNRFNPDTKFEDYSQGGKSITAKQFASSYTLGQSMSPDDARRNITYGRLAQVGNALSVRSGLELTSTQDGTNPTGGAMQAAALLPGASQLGVRRIEREQLDAASVIETLTKSDIKDSLLIDPARLSWGNLNNVQDQFSGISNFGMQLLAAALVVGLGLVFAGFGFLLSLAPSSNSTVEKTDSLGRKPYGASSGDGSNQSYNSVTDIIKAIFSGKFSVTKLLGLTPLRFSTSECMSVGALAFFGVFKPNASLGTLATAAITEAPFSVIQSPGYYSIMARNVTRSFLLIADGFQALGKAFGAGITSGIKQLLETLDVLKNSKFLRAIDLFCRIGDFIKADNSKDERYTKSSTNTKYVRHLSDIDNAENGDAAKKSRLKTYGGGVSALTLAWSAHRSPDAFIMPSSILSLRGVKDVGKIDMPHLLKPSGLKNNSEDSDASRHGVDIGGLKFGPHRTVNSSEKNRISTEDREKIEDALESEYMPFYIQDVRTNEILSFHAFLASLSDDYTASYDSIDGFGRVEAVKVYKNTSRKIGFSFYLAATNPDDFDYMWLKINKLTTMVYPQFTEGRTLLTKDGSYTLQVPFSQTIQAAPLVRVRIGDLIKSNYSKFNLARLFGFGSPNSAFDRTRMVPTSDSEGQAKSNDKIMQEAIEAQFVKGAKLLLTSGELGTPVPKPAGFAIPLLSPPTIVPTSHQTLPPGFVLKVEEIKGEEFYCTVIEAQGDDDTKGLTDAQRKEMELYKGPGGVDKDIFGKTYKLKRENLSLAPSQMKKVKGVVTDIAKYVQGATEFMVDNDPSRGNAVARSFRSSGGKGLAGFIESLSFDWYDRVTWEIGKGTTVEGPIGGRRAPKMCKITVSFSPIHDITPGIDNMGFNRAPIYPVGPYAFNDMRSKR